MVFVGTAVGLVALIAGLMARDMFGLWGWIPAAGGVLMMVSFALMYNYGSTFGRIFCPACRVRLKVRAVSDGAKTGCFLKCEKCGEEYPTEVRFDV
jgi:hypothetical protein